MSIGLTPHLKKSSVQKFHEIVIQFQTARSFRQKSSGKLASIHCWRTACAAQVLLVDILGFNRLFWDIFEPFPNFGPAYFDIRSSQQPTKFSLTEIYALVKAELALRGEALQGDQG